jgi:phosphate uptake regulator
MTDATEEDLDQLTASTDHALQALATWAKTWFDALRRDDQDLRAQITDLQQEVNRLHAALTATEAAAPSEPALSEPASEARLV